MVRVVGPPKLGSIRIVVLLNECIKPSSLVGYTGACVHSICINELGGVLGNSESWWGGGCPHRQGRRVEIEKWGEIYSNFRCKYVFWRESRVFVFWTELLLGLFFISDCKVHIASDVRIRGGLCNKTSIREQIINVVLIDSKDTISRVLVMTIIDNNKNDVGPSLLNAHTLIVEKKREGNMIEWVTNE